MRYAIPAVEVTAPGLQVEVATPIVLVADGEPVAKQNAIPVYIVSGAGVRVAQQDPTPMKLFTAGTVVTSRRNAIPVFVVGGTPGPTNTVAPVISGTPTVGQTLTTTNGTWTGTGTITYTYQWVNSASGNIGGATASTYLLQASDEGDNITCRVTATDDNGSASAVSNSLGPIAASAGRTYAEWQTQAAVLATNGTASWNAGTPFGNYRSTFAAADGSMTGSSWIAYFSQFNAVLARMVQHAMPSQAAYIAASGTDFYFRTVADVPRDLNALNRNGYTSTSAAAEDSAYCDDLIYWDGTQAQRMNPFAGTGPTPYIW